jgi:hypothetical protein
MQLQAYYVQIDKAFQFAQALLAQRFLLAKKATSLCNLLPAIDTSLK